MPDLSVPTKLAGFAVALAVTFGAALGVGALVDPTDDAQGSGGHRASGGGGHGGTGSGHGSAGHGAEGDDDASDAGQDASAGDGHGAHAASAATSGLSSVQDGYRIVPASTRATAGRPGSFRFRIEGPDGRPVRAGYELESERELHLIVVRRDGRGFQHLHPGRALDGTWSTPLTLPSGGSHRVVADFVVGGERRTLGVDVEASGDYRPGPPATPARAAQVDGYRVTLDGSPRAGTEAPLRFRVTRGGRAVTGLEPYLGARGHLVALREGDLAYLHVHPTGGDHGGSGATSDDEHPTTTGEDPAAATTHDDAGSAPHDHGSTGGDAGATAGGDDDADGTISFAATFPAAGRHRLYLQFRTGGVVRTASFVLDVAR